MRYITIKAFNFDELSDGAKKNAIENYRNENFVDQNPWADENSESIKAICATVDVYNYNIDGYNNVEINSSLSDEVLELEGLRAYKYVWNNFIEPNLTGKGKATRHQMEYCCPFTGCYADMILWDAWEEFKNDFVKFNREIDVYGFYARLERAIKKFLDDEDEYYYSDEYVIDCIDSDGTEFTEEGEII